MSVKRYSVWEDEMFEEKHALYPKNSMVHLMVMHDDYAALEARCAALAAENAGLKSKGRELLGEACAVYAKLNKLIDPEIGDFIDGQTLHEFQFALDCETPATDACLAEVRAQGVEAFADHLSGMNISASETSVREFAAQLRKGVQQ